MKNEIIFLFLILILLPGCRSGYVSSVDESTLNINDYELPEDIVDFQEEEYIYLDQENYFPESEGDLVNEELYIYKNSFRNPFSKNNISNDTEEDIIKKIKSVLPFKIKGIIYINKNPRVLIKNSQGNKILKIGDKINDYQIKKINEKGILMRYKDYEIEIAIGG